jgi:rare lipoprotein A
MRESESNFGTGDYLLFTNEIRLAGCSAVALLMMSIPGLANHPVSEAPQPSFETPPSAPSPVHQAPAKKKFSFLRRPMMTGIASWYGAVLNGHKTASGETFDMDQMTACHRTLPFGTMVRVVDTHSGKSVIVRINDRGVLFADRVIDLSRGAAEKLGIRQKGVASVRLEVLSKKQAETEIASEKAAESPADLSQAAAQAVP